MLVTTPAGFDFSGAAITGSGIFRSTVSCFRFFWTVRAGGMNRDFALPVQGLSGYNFVSLAKVSDSKCAVFLVIKGKFDDVVKRLRRPDMLRIRGLATSVDLESVIQVL